MGEARVNLAQVPHQIAHINILVIVWGFRRFNYCLASLNES